MGNRFFQLFGESILGQQEETSRKRPDPKEPEQRSTNAVPGIERRGKREDANEHSGYSGASASEDRLRP